MPEHDLEQSLKSLKEEVTAQDLSTAQTERLHALIREIEHKAGIQDDAARSGLDDEFDEIQEQLNELTTDLENKYPRATLILGRISQALANLGI